MADIIINQPRDNSFKGLGYKTMASIAQAGPETLRSEIRAAGHPELTQIVQEEMVHLQAAALPALPDQTSTKQHRVGTIFARGKIVRYRPTGKKVTILKTDVGRGGDGSPIHEVVDHRGTKFWASEKMFRPLGDQ